MYIIFFNVPLAVDLQLSIKVLGTDGLRAVSQPLYKTLYLQTAVCGPYFLFKGEIIANMQYYGGIIKNLLKNN
jgi:hypothetical protein